MIEIALVAGAVAALVGGAAVYLWVAPDVLMLAGVRIAAAGLLIGVPTGLLYHVELRRALLAARALPERWWLRPTELHRHVPPAWRTRVLGWCYAGAAGFLVTILGCGVIAIAALRML